MAKFEHSEKQREINVDGVGNPSAPPSESFRGMTPAEKKYKEAQEQQNFAAIIPTPDSNLPGPSSPPSYQESYPPIIQGTRNIQVEVHTTPAKKSVIDAYILMIPLGVFGIHHFYLRRPVFGIVYLFTLGLFGVGFVVDLFRLPHLVDRVNLQLLEQPRKIKRRYLDDAYVLWFPFGLIGFHHYYLRRPFWGLLYTVTFGLLGIGWIIDGCRMASLVKDANKVMESADLSELKKKKCDAYAMLCFPFTGVLGFHHYYLCRYHQALFYTLTLGNFGVGWVVDFFRIPSLVKDYNDKLTGYQSGLKRLDDAYMYLFPFGGLLGLHHFYLRRTGWGLLYLCTFAGFGFGYVVDLFRLYWLVKDHNKAIKESQILISQAGRAPNFSAAAVNTNTPQNPAIITGASQQPDISIIGHTGPAAQNYYTQNGQIINIPTNGNNPSNTLYPTDQLNVSGLIEDGNHIPPSYDEVFEENNEKSKSEKSN